MIAAHIVDELVVGQIGRVPALMVPEAISEPHPFGQGFGERCDALAKFGLAVGGAELNRDEGAATNHEMHMRIVETGEDQASTEIDEAGVGTGNLADRGIVADREDLRALERNGLRGRLRGVLRQHFGVDEDQVRLLFRCV
jgi:hypothetical protein